MIRLIRRSMFGAAAAVIGLWGTAIPTVAAADTLRVLAWHGYADDDWVKAF